MPYSPGLKNEHTYIHTRTQHKTQYSIAQHTQTYACTKLNKAHIPVCIWHTHGQLSICTAQTVCLYGTSMSNLPYTQHKLFAYMAQACPTFCTRSNDCLYGTSMSNLLYTQHRLPKWHKHVQPSVHAAQTAYMAQACPTFCTRSTDCLYGTSMSNFLYTQHKLFAYMAQACPTFHTHSTNCLPLSLRRHGHNFCKSSTKSYAKLPPNLITDVKKQCASTVLYIYIFAGSRHAHMLCYGRESTKKWSQYLSQFSFS